MRRTWTAFIRRSSSMAEHHPVIGLRSVILQNDRGIVGLSGFLGKTAGEPCPALVQQRGGNRFGECLFLGGKKFAVFPENKTALPVFAEESPFALRNGFAAPGAGADGLPV